MKKMKIFFIISTMLFTIGIAQAQTKEKCDYKVSVFYEYGWYYSSIVNGTNITLIHYANQNEYHKSGKPI